MEIPHSLPRTPYPDWVKVVAFVGWFLIVGGVVGEWITEGKVNDADTSIQELNDVSLAEARREAGNASERAGKLEKEAAQLRKEAKAEGLKLERRA